MAFDEFAAMVDRFCRGQDDLRARLARAGHCLWASAPGDGGGRNGNGVTDDGGHDDGQG